MKMKFRAIIGLLVSFFCLWLVLKDLKWNDVFLSFSEAKWIWTIPVIFVYGTSFLFRTWRWSSILSPIKKTNIPTLFPILCFGYLINNILPARAGEFARAFAGSKKLKISLSSVLGTIFIERITDILTFVGVMMLASSVIPQSYLPFKKGIVLVVLGFLFILSILIFLKVGKGMIWKNKKGFLPKFLDLMDRFLQGLLFLKTPIRIAIVCGLSIAVWTIELLTIMILSRAFSLDLSFFQSCALLVGIGFGVMIPAAPGYIGTYEFFAQKMLGLLGIEGATTISFVILLHVFHLTISSLLGLPYLIKLGYIPEGKSVPSPSLSS
ncbi:hypothetical protein BVX98_03175 [bacterium F11]|nr:hypothetical protein BVX98_03175 [bacterium F11]